VEGPTRRRLSGFLATCAAAASIFAVAQAAKTPVQAGVFALFDESATAKAEIRIAPPNSGPGLLARVRLFEPDGKTPIKEFAISGERTMQMLLVRDDFATFAHMNPSIDATTGTFHELLTGLDPAHRYYLYADTIPLSMNQQAFRFVVQDEHIAAVPPASTLVASADSFVTKPYTVVLDKTTITANQASQLLIEIKQKGKPAWDLQPYQGGIGFATLINAGTLDYIHVKPVQRGSSGAAARSDAMGGTPQTGPSVQVALPALPVGTYKLWFQFRDATSKIHTAPFTLVAQ
jgi:hypothetical protein